MKHLGDITKLNGAEVPVVDCITGGSPCQDLSVAGKRAGLDGERSGLFMDQIRIVKEIRENDKRNGRTGEFIRPRFMVWENVPGAFSSNKGEDFRAVLEETARIAESDAVIPRPSGRWSNAGVIMGRNWSIAWRVHDAQFWGVPQRRRRIALVADFGGQSATEILFERKGLSGYFETSGKERQDAAGSAGKGVEDASGFVSNNPQSFDGYNGQVSDVQPTIGVNCGISTGRNGVLENVAYTFNTADRKAVFSFQERGGKPGGGKGILIQNEHVGALSTVNNQSIFQLQGALFTQASFGGYKEKVGTLRASGGDFGGGSKNLYCDKFVRRLTPLECERLQGFPDDWTDIGEWTDTKGKLHKESSDSARYKALGNSIALPFWKWLMRRISDQYDRRATLGSLFDGIGGFPLCWEECNGKGSAIWASEIEEFPIAVTKKHFPKIEKGEET